MSTKLIILFIKMSKESVLKKMSSFLCVDEYKFYLCSISSEEHENRSNFLKPNFYIFLSTLAKFSLFILAHIKQSISEVWQGWEKVVGFMICSWKINPCQGNSKDVLRYCSQWSLSQIRPHSPEMTYLPPSASHKGLHFPSRTQLW